MAIYKVQETGGDFASLQLASASISDSDELEIDGPWSVPELGNVVFPQRNIKIRAINESRCPECAQLEPTHYRIVGQNGHTLQFDGNSDGGDYLLIEGVHVINSQTLNSDEAVRFTTPQGCEARVEYCHVEALAGGVSQGDGIYVNNVQSFTLNVTATRVTGFSRCGVFYQNYSGSRTATVNVNHCIFFDNGHGLDESSNTITAHVGAQRTSSGNINIYAFGCLFGDMISNNWGAGNAWGSGSIGRTHAVGITTHAQDCIAVDGFLEKIDNDDGNNTENAKASNNPEESGTGDIFVAQGTEIPYNFRSYTTAATNIAYQYHSSASYNTMTTPGEDWDGNPTSAPYHIGVMVAETLPSRTSGGTVDTSTYPYVAGLVLRSERQPYQYAVTGKALLVMTARSAGFDAPDFWAKYAHVGNDGSGLLITDAAGNVEYAYNVIHWTPGGDFEIHVLAGTGYGGGSSDVPLRIYYGITTGGNSATNLAVYGPGLLYLTANGGQTDLSGNGNNGTNSGTVRTLTSPSGIQCNGWLKADDPVGTFAFQNVADAGPFESVNNFATVTSFITQSAGGNRGGAQAQHGMLSLVSGNGSQDAYANCIGYNNGNWSVGAGAVTSNKAEFMFNGARRDAQTFFNHGWAYGVTCSKAATADIATHAERDMDVAVTWDANRSLDLSVGGDRTMLLGNIVDINTGNISGSPSAFNGYCAHIIMWDFDAHAEDMGVYQMFAEGLAHPETQLVWHDAANNPDFGVGQDVEINPVPFVATVSMTGSIEVTHHKEISDAAFSAAIALAGALDAENRGIIDPVAFGATVGLTGDVSGQQESSIDPAAYSATIALTGDIEATDHGFIMPAAFDTSVALTGLIQVGDNVGIQDAAFSTTVVLTGDISTTYHVEIPAAAFGVSVGMTGDISTSDDKEIPVAAFGATIGMMGDITVGDEVLISPVPFVAKVGMTGDVEVTRHVAIDDAAFDVTVALTGSASGSDDKAIDDAAFSASVGLTGLIEAEDAIVIDPAAFGASVAMTGNIETTKHVFLDAAFNVSVSMTGHFLGVQKYRLGAGSSIRLFD